jgi:hypothetical protein
MALSWRLLTGAPGALVVDVVEEVDGDGVGREEVGGEVVDGEEVDGDVVELA